MFMKVHETEELTSYSRNHEIACTEVEWPTRTAIYIFFVSVGDLVKLEFQRNDIKFPDSGNSLPQK